MNSKLDVEWPEELLKYRDKIEASVMPFIAITATAQEGLSLWQSKFAGLPYFPEGVEYPRDSQGQAMFLLAQINLRETPRLESFPEKGILQFYIASGHEFYGASFENPASQDDFRMLYFPEVTEEEEHLVTNFDFLPLPDMLPMEKQCSLAFNTSLGPVSVEDYRFEPKILNLEPGMRYETYMAHKEVYQAYGKLFPSSGHKIGGYPYFTQSDPRESGAYHGNDYRLLFQMDSDYKAGIMWGDAGVANFFISQKDLENKDFSRVFYNWDCS